MKKKITIQKAHILLIIIGIAFNAIGIFHSNIWFDESYSVGMASHNWIDIWNIGGHDVHPVLYYWILSLFNVMFNGNIMVYRLFSFVCISLLGILGYTHIRKDFGEKTGILFSFFAYFLTPMCIYANEIRMYSLAILLVTILAIYGYRIYKGDTSWKNWIIFAVTSLACIYTHYYGLMAAGIINVVMLFNFIKNRRKQSIKRILIFGIAQAILYLPWMVYFVSQLSTISSNGFWIGFDFPGTLIELLSFQFIVDMDHYEGLNYYIGFAISIIFYIYIGVRLYKLHKQNEDILPAKLSIGIYLATIVAALIVTVVASTSILYYRYLFVVTGLYIFTFSFVLAKEKNKKIIITMCLITAILGISNNIIMIKENYGEGNMEQLEYLQENIQEGDIIVYSDLVGTTITVNFSDYTQYYYNEGNWGIEEAYKAFSPKMTTYVTTDFMDELTGRIWIIDSGSDNCYQQLFNNDEYTFISTQTFNNAYHDYNYVITLVERNN